MTKAWILVGVDNETESLIDKINLSLGISTIIRCQLCIDASRFRKIGNEPVETSPNFSPPP